MGFINRNLVAIVTIPSIVGIHYGWSALQDNPKLVPEGTRIDQPIYSVPYSIQYAPHPVYGGL